MKLVGYVRVSTDAQVERGLGLAVQERAIRAWDKAKRHRLAALTRDEGISGSNGLDSRRGLGDALAAIKEGRASGLVVYRLDRLARDLVLQETLLAEVRRMGGHVFSTSAAEGDFLADDPNDPSRALIRQVLGAVSQYERSMIALRLRAGRRRKHERGEYAYGSPVFGQRVERGELVEDEREARTLARIAELAGKGRSLREIARTLDAEGLKPRRAAHWSAESVRRIVRRLP